MPIHAYVQPACAPAGMVKGGHLPPGNSVVCISSYSKTLGRPIIYALFSQFFVSFAPRPLPEFHPWTVLWDFRLQTPYFAHPWKKILRAPMAASIVLAATVRVSV